LFASLNARQPTVGLVLVVKKLNAIYERVKTLWTAHLEGNLNISPQQHLSIIIIIFLLSSLRIVVVPRTGKNMLFGAAAFIS